MNSKTVKFLRQYNIPDSLTVEVLTPIHGEVVQNEKGEHYFKNSPYSGNISRLLRRFYRSMSPKNKNLFKKEVLARR
jgi:hypothetical protein